MSSSRLRGHARLSSLLLALAALLACGAPARADSGRDSTTPTGWVVYHGQSATDVTNTANSGYRPVSLKVVNGSTPTFDATYVSNTGAYAQTWWWYYNATIADVSAALTTNNARLISVESYDSGGGNRRFAVVMVSNTGANAKTWYWYADNTLAAISTAATAANARVVYVSSDAIGGTTHYNAITISNTGADANSWYWGAGWSTSDISAIINNNGQRLISIEIADPSGPTFNFASEGSHGQRWWWYIGQPDSNFLSLAGQLGARVFEQERYTSGGSTVWAELLLDNSNALTDRIGDILRNTTDGVSGCYIKQVNGPVLAGLQNDTIFEPASTIKALYHLHTLLRIQAGALSLSTTHNVYSGYSGSCPVDTGGFTESFQNTLNLMMLNSDNARAQSIRAYFGQPALNTTAAALGMSNTLVENRMGCGADPSGDVGAVSHPNHLTLTDIGDLYEQVSNGVLNSTYKPYFYSLMDHSLHSDVQTILNQEAAGLGLSAAQTAQFTALVSECYKGGNYGLSNGGPLWYDQTRAGWIKIPHLRPGCSATYYEYVYGTFVNNATNDTNASNAAENAFAELTREQLRAGLASYACPADFNASGSVTVQDIFDFLNAWFAGQPCADFNGANGITVQDIFDFLSAWFAGCS